MVYSIDGKILFWSGPIYEIISSFTSIYALPIIFFAHTLASISTCSLLLSIFGMIVRNNNVCGIKDYIIKHSNFCLCFILNK